MQKKNKKKSERYGFDAGELGSPGRSSNRFRQIREAHRRLILFLSTSPSFFYDFLFVLPFEIDHLEDQTVVGGRWHWYRHGSFTLPRAFHSRWSSPSLPLIQTGECLMLCLVAEKMLEAYVQFEFYLIFLFVSLLFRATKRCVLLSVLNIWLNFWILCGLVKILVKKFIELLRKGTVEDRDSAIACLRTALAPCALDAYPVISIPLFFAFSIFLSISLYIR